MAKRISFKRKHPLLLNKLINRLKSDNHVAGFRVSGIYLLKRNKALKRTSSKTNIHNVNMQVPNYLVLQVLRENCGVEKQNTNKGERKNQVNTW